MPARSRVDNPTFAISTNSSDADAPPVWISETMRVDGGHATAAAGATAPRSTGATAPSVTDAAIRTAKMAADTAA
jgi:hypothetical protein